MESAHDPERFPIDPHVGGLKAGETKKLRGKVYFLENDAAQLLERYHRDFPPKPGGWFNRPDPGNRARL